MEKISIEGIELLLAQPTQIKLNWIGNHEVKRQLEAAWLILSNEDLPMNPRIIGKPGIGKTTLAYCVAQDLTPLVYMLQCTVDTRPEDLLITPVIGEKKKIVYHASPLVTAMLKGGVCILDEGNRMSEKSWASLAPLLDMRRYVESIVAGIKIPAHPEFRLCVTMNEDASTFDVPDYIQSRLQPQIELEFPSQTEELEILHSFVPSAPADLLQMISDFLQRSHQENRSYTTRDGINIARYAVKLLHYGQFSQSSALEQALLQTLDNNALDFYLEGLKPQSQTTAKIEILLLNSPEDLDLRDTLELEKSEDQPPSHQDPENQDEI